MVVARREASRDARLNERRISVNTCRQAWISVVQMLIQLLIQGLIQGLIQRLVQVVQRIKLMSVECAGVHRLVVGRAEGFRDLMEFVGLCISLALEKVVITS